MKKISRKAATRRLENKCFMHRDIMTRCATFMGKTRPKFDGVVFRVEDYDELKLVLLENRLLGDFVNLKVGQYAEVKITTEITYYNADDSYAECPVT